MDDQESSTSFKADLLPFAILWSLCLAYFFGFFGISFLDTDALSQSPSSDSLATATDIASALRRPLAVIQSVAKPPTPRNDTAICSDKKREITSCLDGVEVDFAAMEDDDVLQHVLNGSLKDYQLEKKLGDYERAVGVRRRLYEHLLGRGLESIPYMHYDYNKVFGANCEIVIGYVPIPVGIVGPLLMNEGMYMLSHICYHVYMLRLTLIHRPL